MEFKTKLSIIEQCRSDLDTRIERYKKGIAQLTQKGTSSGKWYIRKDKSPKTGETIETRYIIYPMKDGKRRKEYVGRFPLEISKAQDRMDRFDVRVERISTLDKLESRLSAIDDLINKAGTLATLDSLSLYFFD